MTQTYIYLRELLAQIPRDGWINHMDLVRLSGKSHQSPASKAKLALQRGLIEARVDPNCRREKLYRLTAAGAAELAREPVQLDEAPPPEVPEGSFARNEKRSLARAARWRSMLRTMPDDTWVVVDSLMAAAAAFYAPAGARNAAHEMTDAGLLEERRLITNHRKPEYRITQAGKEYIHGADV